MTTESARSAESVPRWRRLEPDERRQQILSCARHLFGERPYTAVSTSDIAREAGVARGLLNHYFGNKRQLYLEVVRQMVFVPPFTADQLPKGPLKKRVDAYLDRFLDVISRHRKMWLAAIGAQGIGQDPDVERVLREADELAAEQVLDAVDVAQQAEHREELLAMMRAYGGMVKASTREWLFYGNLTRDQVHLLLAQSMLAILREVVPRIQPDDEN